MLCPSFIDIGVTFVVWEHFQFFRFLHHCDLDLWPMTLNKEGWSTNLSGYVVTKFHWHRCKIATCRGRTDKHTNKQTNENASLLVLRPNLANLPVMWPQCQCHPRLSEAEWNNAHSVLCSKSMWQQLRKLLQKWFVFVIVVWPWPWPWRFYLEHNWPMHTLVFCSKSIQAKLRKLWPKINFSL